MDLLLCNFSAFCALREYNICRSDREMIEEETSHINLSTGIPIKAMAKLLTILMKRYYQETEILILVLTVMVTLVSQNRNLFLCKMRE